MTVVPSGLQAHIVFQMFQMFSVFHIYILIFLVALMCSVLLYLADAAKGICCIFTFSCLRILTSLLIVLK